MSNILKGIIKIEAPGVVQATAAVNASISKTEQALKKVTPATNQANIALLNLGRVAQDAPFGIIGIANNLNPLLESFQRTRREAGSFGATMKALGSSLLGGGGIGFALSLITGALSFFALNSRKAKDETEQTTKAIDEAANKQREYSSALERASQEVIQQANSLADLKSILVSTTGEYQNLTSATINQGVASFLFDKKNLAVQQLLSAEVEKQIKLRKQQRPFAGKEFFAEDFTNDPIDKKIAEAKRGLSEVNELSFGLEKIIGSLFSKSFGTKSAKAVKKDIEDIFRQDLKNPIAIPAIFTIEKNYQPPSKAQNSRIKDLTQLGLRPIAVPLRLNLSPEALANRENQARMAAAAKELSDSFTSALTGALANGLASVGEGIGNIISGKGFGAGIVNVIGSLLQTLGQALIQYGIIKEGLDKILGPGGIVIPGAVAIGLGIAATAFGQVFKNFGGFRAAGGPISAGQGYIVGENGPEWFQPGVAGNIIPNNRLGSMPRGGGLGGTIAALELRLKGKDLIAAIAANNQSQRRLGV